MTPDSQTLLEIVEDTRECLKYLKELGIDGFAATNEVSPMTANPLHVETATHRLSRQTPCPTEPVFATPRPAKNRGPEVNQVEQDFLFGDTILASDGGLAPSTETLEEIWANIGNCTRCTLCEGRTNVVNTDGNRNARLMFVGEAPGADEDLQARPFVGRAGQLLTKIIEAMGFKREEVIIGNVNRCRPPGNRQPTIEEAVICKPFLLREIAVVRPEVIVVMGNTAMKNLLDTREGITRVRGKFQDYRGIKVMPTFHPAYLLRDPSKKRETWEDMKKVREYLDNSAAKSGAR
ncbi:MAG: uracil-DNA glycosylase [Blastocatellia bacterium]|jgi:DNA polymerase|nr:uracil-DNA glycosylase [Blastocatellia bacterium]